MTVIAVDGGSTVASDTPSTTLIGLLYAGERVDMLVERPTESATASGARKSETMRQSGAELSLTIGLDLEYVRTFQSPITSEKQTNSSSGQKLPLDEFCPYASAIFPCYMAR